MQDFISYVTRLQLPQGCSSPPSPLPVVLNHSKVCLSFQRFCVLNSKIKEFDSASMF